MIFFLLIFFKNFSFEFFAGDHINFQTPLKIYQKGEEEIYIKKAKYESKGWSWFKAPYYSIRFSFLKGKKSYEIELIHEKLILKNKPALVKHFEISHGYNLILFNISKENLKIKKRFGAGIVYVHSESIIRGKENGFGENFPKGYKISGPAIQFSSGKELFLNKNFSFVFELKLTISYANNVPVASGYAKVPNFAFHYLFGLKIF